MLPLSKNASSGAARILAARSLRAFGDGYVAILLGTYLTSLEFSAGAVGAISTSTLLGSAVSTLLLGFQGHRIPRRAGLMAAGALMAATGVAFAMLHEFWPLMLAAFVGTLNPSGGDVSIFLPLEQTVLAESVPAERRTAIFSVYSFAGAVVGAAGALSVGLVDVLSPHMGRLRILEGAFLLYAAIGLVILALYARLPRSPASSTGIPRGALGPSKRRVLGLAALFSVDAFGGGFVINALLTVWLTERFSLDVATVGVIFFATGLCNAGSFLAAAPLAKRIGLINTMVFTHLPANVLLVVAGFAPNIAVAAACLILRSCLSSMDVPARTSYVMAVVTPPERPAAASVTAVPRSLASAAAPALSGWLLSVSPFGWPLVIGGTLKIAYDLVLLKLFAGVKPPEEP